MFHTARARGKIGDTATVNVVAQANSPVKATKIANMAAYRLALIAAQYMTSFPEIDIQGSEHTESGAIVFFDIRFNRLAVQTN